MSGELLGLINVLKGASDLLRSLIGVKEATAISGQLVDLRFQIMEALEKATEARIAEAAALEREGDLKRKLVQLEDWTRERECYELKEVFRGSLAYALKEVMRGAEPAHYICPACYHQSKKSILQGSMSGSGMVVLSCPSCGLEIEAGPDPNFPISI